MPAPIYLGDEVSGAGYRLAGAHVEVPLAGSETMALENARKRAEVVLIGAAVAAHVAPGALRRALAAISPLTVVVRDLSEAAIPDIATRMRAQLGLDA